MGSVLFIVWTAAEFFFIDSPMILRFETIETVPKSNFIHTLALSLVKRTQNLGMVSIHHLFADRFYSVLSDFFFDFF